MRILLNRKLLRYLIRRGYRFCLSKTLSPVTSNGKVSITLTPVRNRPVLKELPAGFDTYFNIVLEPVQMADGIDDTTIMVDLDQETFLGYIKNLLAPALSKLQTV